MKKLFVVFTLVSLLFALTVCAQAAEVIGSGKLTDTITWSYDSDGTLAVMGTGAIPDYTKANEGTDNPWHIWTGDSKYSQYADHQTPHIKRIVVGDGITHIGTRAFVNCLYLESIELADSVESIGQYAFAYGYTLKSAKVIIGDDTLLDKYSFRDCAAEEDIIATRKTSYTESDYYKKLAAVSLTGKYRTDVVNIALSQLGYHEGDSPADFDGANTTSEAGYSEYGRFLGSEGSDWCSEFYAWCASMAGVPTNVLNPSRSATVNTWVKGTNAKYYTWAETVYGGGDYTPQMGDLLQWAWDLDDHTTSEALSHTSMFGSITDNGDGTVTINSIDGNVSAKVRTKKYTLDERKGTLTKSTGQLCYIISPDYEEKTTTVTKYTVSFSCEDVSFPSKTVAKNGRYGVLPLPSEREGYRFGWYTAETGGERVTMYTKVSLSSDQTLYGRWERISELSGKLGTVGYDYYSDGSLRLTGTLPEGASVYAVSYLDSGQMLGAQIVSTTDNVLSFSEDCSTVRLMLVDASGKPLCDADVISLD